MSMLQNFLRLMLAVCMMAAVTAGYAEDAVKPDGMSSATPYAQEEGRTAGVKSDTQRKAESGAAGVTQSRIRDAGVFQQAEGHAWRTLRNGPVTFYGGWLLMLTPALILAFYLMFGPLKVHNSLSGKQIRRFSRKEQVIHWSVAISFVVLALTGIIILFGKHVLIPVMGHNAFSWVAIIGKNVHNIVGPFFAVGVAAMFITFVRDNLIKAVDLQWLRNVHLVVTGKKHVPSYKYNIGEKAWFWGGVSFLGLIVSASGLVLDFPTFEQTRQTMQIANTVHGIGALLFIAAGLGHIYMGTLGAEGAFKAMQTGMVDETWAKEHHELWYEQVKDKA